MPWEGGALSAWGALTLYNFAPVNLAQKNFSLPWRGCMCIQCTPGYAYGYKLNSLSSLARSPDGRS